MFERLDWVVILEKISGFATSEQARATIRNLTPRADAQTAVDSCQKILQTTVVVASGQRPRAESLDIFQSWFHRLEKNAVLKTLELKDVRHFCIECLVFKEVLREQVQPWLQQVSNELMNAEEPLSAIEQIMTPDGEIRNDASETIFKLIQEKSTETKNLQNTLDRLVRQFEMEPILQEKYVTTRDGRWVLPIKSGMRHKMEGIIHSSSQSKQTVFMEPQEVVSINNRIRQIDVELEEEIERLLKELSAYLSGISKQIKRSQELMLEMDVQLALAQFAKMIEAQGFQFSEGEMQLEDLRHPMLAFSGHEVVSNTVGFDKNSRVLLLSGPNAGGKTVLLKSIGLAAQMARCGLPIAASNRSILPFFKNLSLTIGDEQSVDAHLSTFAAHLKSLNAATELQGPNSLILIDEICGSTDPEEGSALAKSFIEAYSRNGVFAVVTSHLGGLKQDWSADSAVQHGSLEFSSDKGPTYKLLKGIPGQSMAIQTAKRTGVKKNILERALELLDPAKRKQLQELEEIETIKDKLHRILNETANEKKKMHAERMKYEAMVNRFEQEKEKLLKKSLVQAEEKFEDILKQERVRSIFKKHEEVLKIKHELPEVIKASGVAAPEFSITTAEDFAKKFPAGSKVFIRSLSQDGIVQGHPNQKGLVQVLSRSMRLTLPWQDLVPALSPQDPTRDVLRRSGHFSFAPTDKDRVIDLRGLSGDEALSKLESELDKAASLEEDRVKVIHGHGTNTLKKLVRNFLSKSIYVKKWQSGSNETGGDGVTWAEL